MARLLDTSIQTALSGYAVFSQTRARCRILSRSILRYRPRRVRPRAARSRRYCRARAAAHRRSSRVRASRPRRPGWYAVPRRAAVTRWYPVPLGRPKSRGQHIRRDDAARRRQRDGALHLVAQLPDVAGPGERVEESSVSGLSRTPGLPSRSHASRRKNVLRCGISSRRSRSGGTWMRMTLSR